jgi:glycerol uptake facilitator-like aquaporin
MRYWLSSFALFVLVTGAAAQQAPRPRAPELPNPSTGGNIGLAEFFGSRTPYEFWLTCIIITFGLLVIVLLLWQFRSVPDRRAEDVARAVVIVTVIVGTLILVTAGYSNDQIAPAFGLFGTIVGYILGRMSPGPSSTSRPSSTPDISSRHSNQ